MTRNQASAAISFVLAIAIAGCAGSGTTRQESAQAPRHRLTHSAAAQRRRAAVPARSTSGLPYSTAGNSTVEPQPAAGSCHARGSGMYARPDPSCTPGALNPAVTQATIHRTICVRGWTGTVRPPESVTVREKAASMAAYGNSDPMATYEYDHFVPLELGGATNDPRNLWPEPGASPNPKDAVETELRQQVCDGSISLSHAQWEIATNWTSLIARQPRRTRPGAAVAGRCTVAASYNSHYHDYDVYVHSDQPYETVTVSDTDGTPTTGTPTARATPTCSFMPVERLGEGG